MRVVSWNIELGRNIEQAVDELVDFGFGDADIVLLQEMSPASVSQLSILLDMEHRYYADATHRQTGLPFGNAILSRWPMGEATPVRLPHVAAVGGLARSAVRTQVDVDGIPVIAYSIHIETVLMRLQYRNQQVKTIADHTRCDPAKPMIIGGDFNTASRRSIRGFDRLLADVGFVRATDGVGSTFDRFGRSFALDHIYAQGLVPIGRGAIADASASDHQPVWTAFDMS